MKIISTFAYESHIYILIVLATLLVFKAEFSNAAKQDHNVSNTFEWTIRHLSRIFI